MGGAGAGSAHQAVDVVTAATRQLQRGEILPGASQSDVGFERQATAVGIDAADDEGACRHVNFSASGLERRIDGQLDSVGVIGEPVALGAEIQNVVERGHEQVLARRGDKIRLGSGKDSGGWFPRDAKDLQRSRVRCPAL